MASWLHRTDDQFIERLSPRKMEARFGGSFVDAEGNAESNADWIFKPDLSAVTGQPIKYLLRQAFPDDTVTLADAPARAVIDAAEAAANQTALRDGAIAFNTEPDSEGIHIRELFEVFNKRDNYLVNRIVELQSTLDAMKASSGAAQNIRDAIPANWLATNTRTRAEAITDYEDDIDAGGAD